MVRRTDRRSGSAPDLRVPALPATFICIDKFGVQANIGEEYAHLRRTEEDLGSEVVFRTDDEWSFEFGPHCSDVAHVHDCSPLECHMSYPTSQLGRRIRGGVNITLDAKRFSCNSIARLRWRMLY